MSPKARTQLGFAHTVVGEELEGIMAAKPEDFEIAKGPIAEGKVKLHRTDVGEGGEGLDGVLHGLQLLREGSEGRLMIANWSRCCEGRKTEVEMWFA